MLEHFAEFLQKELMSCFFFFSPLFDAGFHSMIPFLTQYEAIQTTIQTDQVRDIPCGTKGGVMISFEKIEVVNRLNKEYVYETILEFGVSYDKTWIYDKIHHEINQFCSSHSLQEVYIDKFDQVVSPLPFLRLSLPGKTIIM
jgi:peptide subunit release factor RF-3